MQSDIWSDCTKNSDMLRPSAGNAILFFNLNLDATPDTSSHHARCPIIEGDLWYATKFFYLNSISTTKNLPKSDDADCTDEDENCPAWAARGECKRNYVFMIGSPDYYGTCRKSCNACQSWLLDSLFFCIRLCELLSFFSVKNTIDKAIVWSSILLSYYFEHVIC